MTREEAKRILLLYRPGLPEESEFSEALEEARRDPELGHWLEQHLATQTALRQKFRAITVPPLLKARILADRKIVHPVWWRRPPVWLAAAASIALLIGWAGWLLRERKPDRFADYRARMVQTVLLNYRMGITSNDGEKVRQYLDSRGAPTDYAVPAGLQKAQLKGGGLLRWRGHPVSMICFDRGDKELLYLFVLDRQSVKDGPVQNLNFAKVNTLMTASWSSGNRIYVLAGPDDAQSIRQYL